MRLIFLLLVLIAVLASCAKTPTAVAAPPPPPPAATSPLDEVGIPTYPGSKQESLKVAPPAPNGTTRVQAEYSSDDSIDKVAEFYTSKLGLMRAQVPGAKLNQLVGKTPTGAFVQILIGLNGTKSRIQYYFILPAKP